MNKKGLIALGLAAFAYYKYNKMTPEQKTKMNEKVKSTGKKLTDYLPSDLKKALNLDKDMVGSSNSNGY